MLELTDEAVLERVACCLPEDLSAEQRGQALAAVRTMLDATPARGGNRVAILRDLGWQHGVCYRRDTQLLIAAMCAIGRGDEQWDRMPRVGRPRKPAAAAAAAAGAGEAPSVGEAA